MGGGYNVERLNARPGGGGEQLQSRRNLETLMNERKVGPMRPWCLTFGGVFLIQAKKRVATLHGRLKCFVPA